MLSQHFSHFLTKHHTPAHPAFEPLVKKLCELTESGSSCIDLRRDDSRSLSEWKNILHCDAEGSAVSSPNANTKTNTPLILTPEGKLFLQRYYLHENAVFSVIDHAARAETQEVSDAMLTRVEKLFKTIEGNDQASAAISALKNRLTIISGGPGTGKTTTVVKILRLLREFGYFTVPSDCLLIAPTGKAADRLRQSIINGLNEQKVSVEDFPTDTSTIHRALGWKPNSIEFRHHAGNPLNAKVVVVDETSMVDLPLMARLLNAIPDTAKIILLGDKNQLASIDVGTVLNDLMDASEQTDHPIRDCSVTLRKSWRTTGAISETCNAIRDGKVDEAWQTITSSSHTASQTPDAPGAIILEHPPKNLHAALLPFVKKHWLPVLLNDTLSALEKLQKTDHFRILTPTHNGPYGVQAINQTVDKILMAHGVGNPNRDIWYAGRSVIVQSNDYTLGIFNGDIGLTLPNESNPDTLNVCFQSGDELKKISPALLPETNTAWALTIHRTQGSEYDHIILIIPPSSDPENPSKILSRELLYTGLSRAKKSATLWCTEESLSQTVDTTVQRASGLTSMFYGVVASRRRLTIADQPQ